MFLKVTPQRTGRIHLAIAQSYREGKRGKTRTIESLGYLDELEKQYEDPIAYFKAKAKEMTGAEQERSAAVEVTVYPLEKIDMRKANRKNIGCAVALCHYRALGIEKTLRNAARARSFEYDPNAIMRLLVTERILHPGSKLAAWKNRDSYFFRSDFSDDDVYRCLSFLCEAKDGVVAAANRAISAAGRRDISNVYYDVTNYYFEIDEEDDLRKKGVSKEHRRDPIVQMGLLQDRNAVPITYRTFPGNTSDCLTMLPALSDLKRDYSLERIIVVADKGLNTSDNIAACVLDNNGFVLSQSIRGTKSPEDVRRWVLDEAGYVSNREGTFKSKSRPQDKMVHIKGNDGRTHDVAIGVKMVAFWSAKYAARARHKRTEVLRKAAELVACPSAYSKATHCGAARYVKNISFDKKTGEIIEDAGAHAELDTEAIAEAQACDGYYCIITSEEDRAAGEIIDIYQGLWRIEEAFKITKSQIEARPVYVSMKEHIEAHFLTCYLALVIIRLIQQDTGFLHSAEAITDELKAMSASHETANWWLFDHRSDLSDELCESVGIDLSRKRMQLKEIKGILATVNKN
jgi:transposase